ncbi:MAG: methyltransferase domain-containing protein [Candidatus Poribacteria bacterium]|nr:methyltransferase domain-containing protein [Candidatus Poribacteria bacterium]
MRYVLIGKMLHQLSHLFGDGPISLQDFRVLTERYASLPLIDQIQIWGRLICLQPILKAINRYIPTTDGVMVDLGCGYGLVSLLVASQRNQAILGIEASPSRLAIAQQAACGLQDVTFRCGDITQATVPPSAVILLIDVLFLFPDEVQRGVLTKCSHALTHNSIILIKDSTTAPAWKYAYATFEESIKLSIRAYGIRTGKQPNYRTPHAWRRLISQANLKVIDECFIESVAPYPGIIYVCQKMS